MSDIGSVRDWSNMPKTVDMQILETLLRIEKLLAAQAPAGKHKGK